MRHILIALTLLAVLVTAAPAPAASSARPPAPAPIATSLPPGGSGATQAREARRGVLSRGMPFGAFDVLAIGGFCVLLGAFGLALMTGLRSAPARPQGGPVTQAALRPHLVLLDGGAPARQDVGRAAAGGAR